MSAKRNAEKRPSARKRVAESPSEAWRSSGTENSDRIASTYAERGAADQTRTKLARRGINQANIRDAIAWARAQS